MSPTQAYSERVGSGPGWTSDPAQSWMSPSWARWFDMLKAAGGGRKIKLAGGASPEGSNQLRGTSVQPDEQPSGIASDPNWWVAGEFAPTTRTQLDQRMERMPPSLHGLYIAGLRKKAKAT